MKKKQKILRIRVLFNASVVLSGINSPKGGSAKTLSFVEKGLINGTISEVILDEILRHSGKFDISKNDIFNYTGNIFKKVLVAPSEIYVKKCGNKVIDEGDAHILATCLENNIPYLVTLDKKHLLVLKGKIKGLTILTPGELIKMLS